MSALNTPARRRIALAAVVLCLESCASSDSHSMWQRHLDQADSYARTGDVHSALNAHLRAIELSTSLVEKARAQIALADFLLEKEMDLMPPGAWSDPNHNLRDAADHYRLAITFARQGSGENPELLSLEVLATNNLSTVLLRLSRPAEAIERMSALLPNVAANDRPRFLYNYGLCLEQARRIPEALAVYLEIIRGNQEVRPALERAKRLTAGKTEATLDLCLALIHIGELDKAESLLRSLLSQPERLRDASELRFSSTLATFLTESRLAPDELRRTWQADLDSLANALSTSSQRVSGLVKGYLAPLPASVEPAAAEAAFPGWQENGEMQKTFSALLHSVGRLYARSGQSSSALSRFALAYAMDPENRDALSYALNLLASDPGQLDPERKLLDRISDRVQGNAEWLTDANAATDFYALFGAAMEARVPLDGQEARLQAIAAWERALASKFLSGEPAANETDSFPAATLHRSLAQAYAESGQHDRSFRQYLAAAEGFARAGRELEASKLLNAARSLPYEPSADERFQLANLLPAPAVTVTAFLDPKSSDARRTVPELLQRINRYGQRVKLKLQPQPPSASSKIEEALLCSEDQSRLWEMQAFLFQQGWELREDEIKAEAANLGLDVKTFTACLDTGKYTRIAQAQLKKVHEIGLSSGSQSTIIFVNGRFVGSSKLPKEMFRELDAAVSEQLQEDEALAHPDSPR